MSGAALEGVRVLDLATFISAGFCGTILAEFGAEVIKVEQPGVGDPLRKFGTQTPAGDSLVWLTEARNKRSITLDLRQERGAALLKQLVAKSDVLLENFRPGTLERWGVGWEELRAVNPKLVMLRISGYGQTGPKASEPGFARIAHAFSGLSYLAGTPESGPLMPGSTSLADYASGTYGALGVLLALRARDRTGRGQFIDIALYEPTFRYLDEMASAFAYNGTVRERMGADTVNVVPHSHYKTRDEKWIAIACTSDKMFARLADAMDAPELASDDRWGRVATRLAERDAVNRAVSDWTGGLTQREALSRCRAADVPAGPIHSVADIFEDAHFAERGNLVRVKDSRIPEEVVTPSVVPRLSDTPGEIRHLGPSLGEHCEEVLEQLLGLSADEVRALREARVI
ncbi:MAG: CoA transferase [Myxococcales bacterium]|nr:CoA transferase [Myxococcales bacterium]